MFSGYNSTQEGRNEPREEENQRHIYSYISIFQINVEVGTIFWAGNTAQAKTQRHDIV